MTDYNELMLKRVSERKNTLGKRVATRFYNFDNLNKLGKVYISENFLYLADLVDAESKIMEN